MVILHKLTHRLSTLGLHPTICDWLLDFLTSRHQSVRNGNRTSARIITNTGTPQGCVRSPILYTLFTHDCIASRKDNIILKFVDDMAVIGCIIIYHCRVHSSRLHPQRPHPQHGLFTFLPSGQRYRSVRCRTTMLKKKFHPHCSQTPKQQIGV